MAGESGSPEVSQVTDSVSGSATTGDFWPMLAGIIAIIIGGLAIGATILYRKKVFANVGAHVKLSNNNVRFIQIASIVALALVLSMAVFFSSNHRAIADETTGLTGTDTIATVNPDTGDTVFADAIITNNSTEAQQITEYKLEDSQESKDVKDVKWTITIEDVEVYNGTIKEGTVEFEPIIILPGKSVTLKTSASNLSPELAKSLIGKTVTNNSCSYDVKPYYSGKVVDANSSATPKAPISGATVVFTDSESGAVSKTTTDASGAFNFGTTTEGNPVIEGTHGVITIDYKDGNNNWYTNGKREVTEKITEDFEISRLISLQVQITDNTSEGQTPRVTCWCPILTEKRSDVAFYDYNRELIPDVDGDGYSMEEIASKDKTAPDAYKTQANYFTYLGSSQKTLNCFQSVDMPWDEAFYIKNLEDREVVADYVNESAIMDRVKALPEDSVQNVEDVRTVYCDNEGWIDEWSTGAKLGTKNVPTVCGYQYPKYDQASESDLVDIYGKIIDTEKEYSIDDSKILSKYAAYPWGATSYNKQCANFWMTDINWWTHNRLNNYAVVIQKAFSNDLYEVSAQVDDDTHGSVSPTKLTNKLEYGTKYFVDGDTITFETGEATPPSIKYSATEPYIIAKWQFSTDNGKSWRDLDNKAYGSITGSTIFKAVTFKTEDEAVSLVRQYGPQTVTFVPSFVQDGGGTPFGNLTFYNSKNEKITFDDNITFWDFVQLYKDPDTRPVYFKGKPRVYQLHFYGVLDETWNNVFVEPGTGETKAKGLKADFKTWLNNNGLKTVYFAENDDITPLSEFNWDHSATTQPKIDGNYSYPSWYDLLGKYNGGLLSYSSDKVWAAASTLNTETSQWEGNYWNVTSKKWEEMSSDEIGGVVLKLTVNGF